MYMKHQGAILPPWIMKPIQAFVVLLSSKGEAWRALLNYFKMSGGGGTRSVHFSTLFKTRDCF